jgi:carbonic anhydrase
MTELARLLEANEGYAAARAGSADSRPRRHLAIITCMDVRIDVLAALGLHLGEAHILRNAGGRVTDDVLRSLAVSCNVLGVDTAVLMQHSKCGLSGVTNEHLQAVTGAHLDFLPIADHADALRHDVELLAGIPYLASLEVIAGLVYNVETGRVGDLVQWVRPVQAS